MVEVVSASSPSPHALPLFTTPAIDSMESSVATEQRCDAAMAAMVGKDEFPAASSSVATMQRRIEFHPARKHYRGFGTSRDFQIETLNPDSEKRSTASVERQVVAKRGDGAMDLLESEISSLNITFQRIGAGLRNIGNTCFLNSVLQCLTYTAPLAAYLQSGKHKSSCRIAGFCALCAIQKHVSRALQSSGMSFVPDLVSNMRCISRNLKVYKQEDAHEYMVNLLESMHKCCLPAGVHSESPAAYERSLVHKIFGGHLRSQVECQQCSYSSDKFDPFLDLSLEINKADALPTALRNFTAADMLDGGEKHYHCQHCKQKVRAKKRLTVHKPPNVLSIHLKRFSAHNPGRKIEKKVSYDRSLDMRPFVSNPNEGDLNYSLYGVLVHYGNSTHFGHYVCFVRTSSGMWYCLDDDRVRHIGEKNVLNQNAYMLFYVRDRKHTAPTKPVDDVKKETKPNMLAKLMPNGVHTGNKTAPLEVGLPKEAQCKETPDRQNSESLKGECSMTKAEPASASECLKTSVSSLTANVSFAKPMPNGVQTGNQMAPLDVGLPKEAQEMPDKQNNKPLKAECSTAAAEPVSASECLKTSVSSLTAIISPSPELEDCIVSCAVGTSVGAGVSSSSSDEQNIVTGKLSSDETARKTVSASQISNAPVSTASVDNKGQVDSAPSLTKPSCQKNQDAEAGDEAKLVDEESSKSETKALISNERQPQTQSGKRKLLKHPIHKLHLGTNFFRASLCHGIKKKNRKRKHRNSDTLKLLKQQLEENESPSEMKPTTSGSANSQKESNTLRPKEESAGVSAEDFVHRELSERNTQNSVVLATAEQSSQRGKVSTFMADDDKTDAMQNGVEKVSSQDLRKEAASLWNDVPRNRDSKQGENVSIGYIGDEWDEVLDQGKKKKVRLSKTEFGGPNLFQQVALQKLKHQHEEPKVDGKWMRREKRRRQ